MKLTIAPIEDYEYGGWDFIAEPSFELSLTMHDVNAWRIYMDECCMIHLYVEYQVQSNVEMETYSDLLASTRLGNLMVFAEVQQCMG